MIEIFINDGEYVLSSAVYNLNDEIRSDCVGKIELYTVE